MPSEPEPSRPSDPWRRVLDAGGPSSADVAYMIIAGFVNLPDGDDGVHDAVMAGWHISRTS